MRYGTKSFSAYLLSILNGPRAVLSIINLTYYNKAQECFASQFFDKMTVFVKFFLYNIYNKKKKRYFRKENTAGTKF